VPVIAVSAVRTGCGKSQTARYLSGLLKARGLRVAVIRHPMPYGDLRAQAVQRFACARRPRRRRCTVEEREEYEPHLACGNVVFAGVDYARIVAAAEREADVILWDGGNNDFPFVRPDLHIVLVDPLRPGHETDAPPGRGGAAHGRRGRRRQERCGAAGGRAPRGEAARAINPRAQIIRAASPVRLDDERRCAAAACWWWRTGRR
jgi:predicted GTPase